MADSSNITTAYADMFNGYQSGWKVSGTALPNYLWAKDGVYKQEVTSGEGKNEYKRTVVTDIDSYDIMADDAPLRAAPARFEQLRTEYHLRG